VDLLHQFEEELLTQETIICVLCGYAGRYISGTVCDISCTVRSKLGSTILWVVAMFMAQFLANLSTIGF